MLTLTIKEINQFLKAANEIYYYTFNNKKGQKITNENIVFTYIEQHEDENWGNEYQGKEGECIVLFKAEMNSKEYFIQMKYFTDSYGSEQNIGQFIGFVEPKEKLVTVYEPI